MGEGSGVDIERKGSYPLVFNGLNSPTNPAVPDQHKYMVVIVPFIVVVNSVMFIVTMYANNCPRNSDAGGCIATFLGRFSFQPFSENPLLGPSSLTLEKMGALVTSKIENDNQGWRLITCIWIHAGVFHVLANMLSLLFIGIRFEQEFGFLRIGSVYLLSGFGGSLLSALFIQNRISVGASGALFGLLGAMVSELITNSTIYTNKRAALTVLILIVALNLAMGLLPHVDNFAHIGGFLSGFLLGFIFLIKPQYGWINPTKIPPRYEVGSPAKSKHRTYQYVLWISSLLLLIAGFTTAMVMVFHGYDANSHCRWCHYLSCVPTAKWSCHDSASCEVSKEFPFLTPHK